MPQDLKPPRMFPRTEGQAKATLVMLLFVIVVVLSYLLVRGVNLGRVVSEQ